MNIWLALSLAANFILFSWANHLVTQRNRARIALWEAAFQFRNPPE